jgi:uroporphyrinogen-III synthase
VPLKLRPYLFYLNGCFKYKINRMKVKTILVSQPAPKTETSPYFDLSEKQKVKIDFRSFIHVEGIPVKDIRAQKVDLSKFTAIILTSRNAVDHFFRVAEEMRFSVPDAMKYFCQSEAVAYYLQKYVVYRKRKIYVGKRTFPELTKLIKKHKEEKFLLPSSDKLKPLIPEELDSIGINWKRADFYRTVMSDLSDLENVFYDVLVFFSPSGIDSLYKNFPDFQQNNTRIAAFGNSTIKAVEDAGLTCNVIAPTPEMPSMTMALERYLKEVNKK